LRSSWVRKASKDVWAILKTIGEIEKRGTEALAVRVEAYTAVSRGSIPGRRTPTRRGVEAALETWAVANGKPRGYADAFFPAAPREKKKATPI
jgi:hypothetical protein